MKKLSPSLKKHLISRSNEEIKKRTRRRNKTITDEDIIDSFAFRSSIRNRLYHNVLAPAKFTLGYEHVHGMLVFIKEIKYLAHKGLNINIVMDDINEIADGAIAMFLSVLAELTKKRILCSGTYPKDKASKDKLEKSGFFSYINGSVSEHNKNTKNSILTTGHNDSNQYVLAKEVKKASETVWGQRGRNPHLYSCILEMMRNSCDHAFQKKNKIVWHLGVSHEEENNNVNFSFVDNGNGIIKTFANQSVFNSIKSIFSDEVDFLLTAYNNGIESRTGLKWRGKGLPTIRETFTDNHISNLVVISNKVYIDFQKGIFRKLNVNFKGTYYYWKLNSSCIKTCFYDTNTIDD